MTRHFLFSAAILFISISAFCQDAGSALQGCEPYFDTLTSRQLYRAPEKDAEYKGGTEKFANYINQNFIYDKSHVDRETSLIFTFIVEPDGSVSNVSLLRPARGVADDVIERGMLVMEKMPKLKPAICHNQKVPQRLSQPITVSPAGN
ncbi:MAG TPA: hypothetical protein VGM24_10340 [Puia sp.]